MYVCIYTKNTVYMHILPLIHIVGKGGVQVGCRVLAARLTMLSIQHAMDCNFLLERIWLLCAYFGIAR